MSGNGLLDQLLKSGQDLYTPRQPGEQNRDGLTDSLGGLLNQRSDCSRLVDNLAGLFKDKEGNSQLGSFLAGAGGGALAGSVLSLLLG